MYNYDVHLFVCVQAQEAGRPTEHASKFYIRGALPFLVPILLLALTKQVCCDGL